jgi:hypothetical protein
VKNKSFEKWIISFFSLIHFQLVSRLVGRSVRHSVSFVR